MTYVRIKTQANISADIPRSISTGGAKIVQGGAGTEVKDAAVLDRIRKIGGEHIETSPTPFPAEKSKGGIIDLESMKMVTPGAYANEGYPELVAMAKARGISLPMRPKKEAVIAALEAYDTAKSETVPPGSPGSESEPDGDKKNER